MDQVIAGRADYVNVVVDLDGSVALTDNGPGIPLHNGASGVPFVEEVFTTVRTTPSLDGHLPHVHLAGGTGLGPVSAVCRSLVVETRTAGGGFRQSFARGRVASTPEPLPPNGATTGTMLRLVADPEIFGDARLDAPSLTDKLRTLAWLAPGLTVEVNRERFGPVEDLASLFDEWRSPTADLQHGEPFLSSGSDGSSAVSLALGWIGSLVAPRFRSFCNYREVPEGGAQLQGIDEGLRLVFGQAPMRDLMLGLVGVLHVTMLHPDIAGPTRGRLDSPEAIWLVADVIAARLPAFLAPQPAFADVLRGR